MPKFPGIVKKYNRWYYWVYHGGRTTWSRGFHTAGDASRAREAKVHEIHRQRATPADTLTVKDFVLKYLNDYALPNLRRATIVQLESIARLYIIPHLGDVKLGELTKQHFITLRATLHRDRTPSVAYQTLRITRKNLNVAVEWDYLAYNPVPRKIDKVPERKHHPTLPMAQIDVLINGLSGMDRAVVALATYTGLRRGELFALKWSDINFELNTIQVERQYTSGEITSLKTPASRATIPMLSRLPALMQEWRDESGPKVWVFPGKTPALPFRSESWAGDQWLSIRQRFHLPEGFRFHDLRHSLATNLIEAGVPVPFVQLLLRHRNYQTTANTYGHHTIENVRETLEKSFKKISFEDSLEGSSVNPLK